MNRIELYCPVITMSPAGCKVKGDFAGPDQGPESSIFIDRNLHFQYICQVILPWGSSPELR